MFIMKKEFTNDGKVDILKAHLIWVSFKRFHPLPAISCSNHKDFLGCFFLLPGEVLSLETQFRCGLRSRRLPIVPGRVTLSPVGAAPSGCGQKGQAKFFLLLALVLGNILSL